MADKLGSVSMTEVHFKVFCG